MKFETVRIHVFSLFSPRNFATMATWSNDSSPLFILIGHFRVPKKKSHFQNEAKCETFVVKMSFICIIIKNHFHINGFALSLALKVRFFGTRKWPFQSFPRDLRYVISPRWSLALSCEWYTWVSLVFGAAKPAARDGISLSTVRSAANQRPSMALFTTATK